MLTMIKIIEIIKTMKINLDDKLVEELNSLFENERKTQSEWDVCIEDIVEEYIARQTGTWEELYCEEDDDTNPADELEEIYIDLRNGTGKNGEHKHTITKPPFKNPSTNLRKPFRQ